MGDDDLSLPERLLLIEEAEEAYDECPECDAPLLDIDHTKGSGVLFIHEQKGVLVDGCSVPPEDLDRLEGWD